MAKASTPASKKKAASSSPASQGDLLDHPSARDWTAWLKKNHASSEGVWVRLAKKGSPRPSATGSEMLDIALCYGWIDAHRKGESEHAWLQRYTPRKPDSIWSKVNRAKAEALIESGKMTPAGLRAIEQARQNGRWRDAYDSPSSASVPEDLEAALNASAQAKAFFATLSSRNRYAILFRIQTAKQAATREKHIRYFIEMLERRETVHP